MSISMGQIIGIDCGLDGAIAILSNKRIVELVAMPTVQTGKRREIDIDILSAMFEQWAMDADMAMIEDPGGHAPSAAGLRSMTYSFAIMKTLAVVYRIPFGAVMARKWQSTFWKKPPGKYNTKAAALTAAESIWPVQDWRRTARSKKAFDGFVDAALIAEYARRIN